jgi:hypothetical protein
MPQIGDYARLSQVYVKFATKSKVFNLYQRLPSVGCEIPCGDGWTMQISIGPRTGESAGL